MATTVVAAATQVASAEARAAQAVAAVLAAAQGALGEEEVQWQRIFRS